MVTERKAHKIGNSSANCKSALGLLTRIYEFSLTELNNIKAKFKNRQHTEEAFKKI